MTAQSDDHQIADTSVEVKFWSNNQSLTIVTSVKTYFVSVVCVGETNVLCRIPSIKTSLDLHHSHHSPLSRRIIASLGGPGSQ